MLREQDVPNCRLDKGTPKNDRTAQAHFVVLHEARLTLPATMLSWATNSSQRMHSMGHTLSEADNSSNHQEAQAQVATHIVPLQLAYAK